MNNQFRALVLTSLLLGSSLAQGDLIEINRGNTPGRVYIDMDSISRQGDIVTLKYVLDVYRAHLKASRVYGKHELAPLEYYKSNRVELAFNCPKHLNMFIGVEVFENAAATGSRVSHIKEAKSERAWKPITHGSTWSLLYPYVCKD